jgi:hypothetical protein
MIHEDGNIPFKKPPIELAGSDGKSLPRFSVLMECASLWNVSWHGERMCLTIKLFWVTSVVCELVHPSFFQFRLILLFLVSVPVNICLADAIENRIGVRFAKIVPTPFNEGLYFRTDRSE